MDIFNKRPSISKREFKDVLRKSPGIIPGAKGQRFDYKERRNMEKSILQTNFSGQITKDDYKGAVRRLNVSKHVAKDGARKTEISNRIKYLKK